MNWVLIVGVFVCATFCEKSASEEPLLPAGITCLPGSEWNNRCNHCKCLENGTSSCTNLTCTDKLNEPDLDCAPETVWKYECNVCACSPYGRMICTRMACNRKPVLDFNPVGPKKPEPVAILETENRETNGEHEVDSNLVKRQDNEDLMAICKASLKFKLDCNFCQCDDQGTSYTCTANDCMEGEIDKDVEVFKDDEDKDEAEKGRICKPRDTFYISCNVCHCNVDGTSYSCTNKPCPLPKDVELFHELRESKPVMP